MGAHTSEIAACEDGAASAGQWSWQQECERVSTATSATSGNGGGGGTCQCATHAKRQTGAITLWPLHAAAAPMKRRRIGDLARRPSQGVGSVNSC